MAWAGPFLDECRDLDAARLVLRLVETGAMRLATSHDGFDAWLSGPSVPALWQERADLDAWARAQASRAGSRWRGGEATVAAMAYQLPYPTDAEVGGIAVRSYRAVLAALIDRARVAGERGRAVDEGALAREVAAATGLDAEVVARGWRR